VGAVVVAVMAARRSLRLRMFFTAFCQMSSMLLLKSQFSVLLVLLVFLVLWF
jgi:hypothetical protein